MFQGGNIMLVLCKKDVIDSENGDKVSYSAGKKYEAKIIADDDLLATDNTGEFALISVRDRLGLELGKSDWGSWFDEHFELIP
jgi:hypothetical protein